MSISVHLVDSSRGTGSTHMEVIPLPLELGGGVHLVGHDASNGLYKMVGQWGSSKPENVESRLFVQ